MSERFHIPGEIQMKWFALTIICLKHNLIIFRQHRFICW